MDKPEGAKDLHREHAQVGRNYYRLAENVYFRDSKTIGVLNPWLTVESRRSILTGVRGLNRAYLLTASKLVT